MCNAVLFWNFDGKVNGSLMNALEYYVAILEHNPEIYLYMLNCPDGLLQHLRSIYEDRYILEDLKWKENIVNLKTRGELIRTVFDKVLVVDFSTILKTRGLINAKEIIVIQELYTYEDEYQYSKDFYNVTYYGEMPFVRKDKEYRMKMLFHRFKSIEKSEDNIFLNNQRWGGLDFLKKIQLPDKPILQKTPDHKFNLFELYSTYVYYHSGTWFDPHPRLFHESHFYGKDIIYFNPKKIMDGSYYRFHDVRYNGLKDRCLNKEDDIVRLFI